MSQFQSPLSPMLRKLQLWSCLSDGEQAAVLDLPFVHKELLAGDYIVRAGTHPTSSALLLDGLAFRQKMTGGGARSILAVHLTGDMVDLQNALLGLADHSVQALTRLNVAFIPRDAIIDLARRHPRVGLAMWYDTLVDGSIFREWIANISRRDAAARLAHLLCEFGERLEAIGMGSRLSYELPMTQEQLADALGLTSVHINRTLKRLEGEGLITRTQRSVRVADWEKLAHAADFNPDYLHLVSAPAGTEQVERKLHAG